MPFLIKWLDNIEETEKIRTSKHMICVKLLARDTHYNNYKLEVIYLWLYQMHPSTFWPTKLTTLNFGTKQKTPKHMRIKNDIGT